MATELTKDYYPGLNRLLIEEQALPSANSLLVTPDSRFKYGTIVAAGSIKDRADIDTTTYKVGDNVYFLAQSGFNIELPEGTFRLINVQEVLVGEKS